MNALISENLGLWWVKSLALSGVFMAGHALLRRNPAGRVMLCRIAAVALIALPAFFLLPDSTAVTVHAPEGVAHLWQPYSARLMREPVPAGSRNLADAGTGSAVSKTVANSATPAGTTASPVPVVATPATANSVNRPLLVWAVVAALLTGRWLVALAISRRLLRGTGAPDAALRTLTGELSARIGLKRPVPVVVVKDLASPLLLGPSSVILIPERLLSPESHDDLVASLAHELMHVRRSDWWWSQTMNLVAAVFWPVLPVHALRPAHDAAAEIVCDGLVAPLVGGAESYAGALARQSLHAVAHPHLASVAMLRRSGIRLRVERLLSGAPLPKLTRRLAALSVVCTIVVCGALGVLRMKADEPVVKSNLQNAEKSHLVPTKTEKKRVLLARVVDRNGKPVVGASIIPTSDIINHRGGSESAQKPTKTDEKGEFSYDALSNYDGLMFRVVAPGYAEWQNALDYDGVWQTVTLVRSVSVTGRLIQNGKPIKGVKMAISNMNRGEEAFVLTDSEGRFTFMNVGAGAIYRVIVAWPNSDVRNGGLGGSGVVRARVVEVKSNVTSINLDDMLVEQGVVVTGRVKISGVASPQFDTNDQVSVWCSECSLAFDYLKIAPDGSFSCRIPEGAAVGFRFLASQLRSHNDDELRCFKVTRNMAPLTLGGALGRQEGVMSLGTALAILGQVVDSEGNAIAGARIRPSADLDADNGSDRYPSELKPVVTDAEGRFKFPRPSNSKGVSAYITAPGFAARRCELRAQSESTICALKRGGMVKGRLIKDGAPLGGVRLELLATYHADYSDLEKIIAKTATDGTFVFKSVPDETLFELMAPGGGLSLMGVLPDTAITLPAEGGVSDIGNISLLPGVRVAVEPEMRDGGEITAKSPLYVCVWWQRPYGDTSYPTARDLKFFKLTKPGSFTFCAAENERVLVYAGNDNGWKSSDWETLAIVHEGMNPLPLPCVKSAPDKK